MGYGGSSSMGLPLQNQLLFASNHSTHKYRQSLRRFPPVPVYILYPCFPYPVTEGLTRMNFEHRIHNAHGLLPSFHGVLNNPILMNQIVQPMT
jgi:hypothetical protein